MDSFAQGVDMEQYKDLFIVHATQEVVAAHLLRTGSSLSCRATRQMAEALHELGIDSVASDNVGPDACGHEPRHVVFFALNKIFQKQRKSPLERVSNAGLWCVSEILSDS